MRPIVNRTLLLLFFWFVAGVAYNIWIQTGDTQMALGQMKGASGVYMTSNEGISRMFFGMCTLISCCFGVWIFEAIMRKAKNEVR
jgi:hypothetical protein